MGHVVGVLATPRIEATISFTVMAVCSVASCWPRAPRVIFCAAPVISLSASPRLVPVCMILPRISRRFRDMVLMAAPRVAISVLPSMTISCYRSPAAILPADLDVDDRIGDHLADQKVDEDRSGKKTDQPTVSEVRSRPGVAVHGFGQAQCGTRRPSAVGRHKE
jgi:hypothetical protein